MGRTLPAWVGRSARKSDRNGWRRRQTDFMEKGKVKSLKAKRTSSVLGLVLDGSRLDGVVVRRPNGSLQLHQTFSVSLSLDPLTADPELVGREIRNHLDNAGVRERA